MRATHPDLIHMTPQISQGFSDTERPMLAALYWQAFGAKLDIVLGPDMRALSFLAPLLDPSHALVARDSKGKVLGVAGFASPSGRFVGGGLRDLWRGYGTAGTLWRAPLLALLERGETPGTLTMDGICVAPEARGQGVGTTLLEAIVTEAGARGLDRVRLDVIDTNPRARALYERMGFRAGDTADIWPFHRLFGFRQATTMTRHV